MENSVSEIRQLAQKLLPGWHTDASYSERAYWSNTISGYHAYLSSEILRIDITIRRPTKETMIAEIEKIATIYGVKDDAR